jgi:hypothetical protein
VLAACVVVAGLGAVTAADALEFVVVVVLLLVLFVVLASLVVAAG